jgi:hypothetical protein
MEPNTGQLSQEWLPRNMPIPNWQMLVSAPPVIVHMEQPPGRTRRASYYLLSPPGGTGAGAGPGGGVAGTACQPLGHAGTYG